MDRSDVAGGIGTLSETHSGLAGVSDPCDPLGSGARKGPRGRTAPPEREAPVSPATPEQADKNTRIAVVQAEIIKPLDGTWEEVGPVLWRLHWAAHRCLNAAIRACHMRPPGDGPAAATLAYRAVGEQVAKEAEYEPAFSVSSAVMATWSKGAADHYASKKKDIWRGDISIPSYKKGAPIMVRQDGWDVSRDEKGYVLAARLTGGKTGRARFAVVPSSPSAHAELRRLCAGESSHCDLRIVRDKRQKGWFAKMTLRKPRPVTPSLDVTRALAVHRGIRVLMTGCDVDGRTWVIDDGGAVRAYKEQMFRRRRSWYATKRKYGASGARGHGYWRRYETYRELEDKEARWVKDKVRQLAAGIVKDALAGGFGTIVLDDWSAREAAIDADRQGKERLAMTVRRWPFAMQREAIEAATKKAGIVVQSVASENESCTCPRCGNVDASQNDGRGTFTCSRPGCDTKRSVEAVAAWNMLAAAGFRGAFVRHAEKVDEFAAMARERRSEEDRMQGSPKPGGARSGETKGESGGSAASRGPARTDGRGGARKPSGKGAKGRGDAGGPSQDLKD